jgi:RimJ/RimL family protein N-acetyltransferase
MNYKCLTNNNFNFNEFSLESIRAVDIESIRNWRNAQLDVLRQDKIITKEEQIKYFNDHIWPETIKNEPRNILFSFFRNDDLIGYGGLVHISWKDLRAEISFLINPENLSDEDYCLFFSSFLTLIKSVAFDYLKFNRLFTETFNIRQFHISILESNGFIREGVLKEHVIINGKYVDSIFHGCLNK